MTSNLTSNPKGLFVNGGFKLLVALLFVIADIA